MCQNYTPILTNSTGFIIQKQINEIYSDTSKWCVCVCVSLSLSVSRKTNNKRNKKTKKEDQDLVIKTRLIMKPRKSISRHNH